MEEKIRIVHCVKAVAVGGGVARMDAAYHRHLPKERFDLTFLVLDDPQPGVVPYDATIPFVYTGRADRFGKAVALFARADIVQFSDGFQPLVCEAARVAGVPALVEINHDIEAGQLYDTIDVTICVSEAARVAKPRPDKTVVIHNGIEPAAFPYFARAPRDRFVILQVGSRGKASLNLDELADQLLPLDPRIELVVAGFDQTLPDRERVTFRGVVDDVVSLYHDADLLFLHSKKEAFGLTVVEGMATGLVPLVADHGGPAEIVEPGVTGFLVPPGNRAAMVAAVREALAGQASGRLTKMGRAARRAVEERFDIRQKIGEYALLYEKLVAEKGRRRRPAPSNPGPPPEAWLDDALFHFDAGRWDEAAIAARNAFAHPAPIRIPLVAWLARQFARHARAKNDPDLAHHALWKLFTSGYRDGEWMKEWLTFAPIDFDLGPVVAALLPLAPDDPEVIMAAVEEALGKGAFDRASTLLDEGCRRVPGNGELVGLRDLLKERLGR